MTRLPASPHSKIWFSVSALKTHLDKVYPYYYEVVCTSGGFDPIHCGHIACLTASANLGDVLIAIVNSDSFLLRKKGYFFMSLQERMEIVSSIAGVDYVTTTSVEDEHSQFVDGTLRILKPHIFAKGGDRSTPETIAECERAACREAGCRIVYGVGGTRKINSSSALIHRIERLMKHGNIRQESCIQTL